MSNFACMSHHAFKRVGQRTLMTWKEVANLLDRKVCVDSGHLPGFSRHHFVFYSSMDQTCFVAIQDVRSGTVVTVLPLTYQARLTWAIPEETCARAKLLYEEYARVEADKANVLEERRKAANAAKIASARSFVISMHFVDAEGQYKTQKLMSVRAAKYDFEIDNLIRDKQLPDLLQNCLEQSSVLAKSISAITIRNGRKVPPHYIDLH